MMRTRRVRMTRLWTGMGLALLIGSLAGAVGWSSDLGDLLKNTPLPRHVPAQLPALPANFSWPKDPDGISTSLDDAYPAAAHLPPGFAPDEAPAQDARLASDGQLVIGTGYYDFHLRSYCLHAGMYRPRASGDGYLLAPLRGPRAGVIGSLLRRSAGAPDIPQAQIQVLIWAILSGTTLARMPAEQRSVAERLLRPSELLELAGGWKDLIPDRVRQSLVDRVNQNLPDAYSRSVSAYLSLRDRLEAGSAAYADLEAIAAPQGDAVGPGSRAVDSGTWIAREGGYFVRFLPSGYVETQLQIYRPLAPTVHMSIEGRVESIDFNDGRSLQLSYEPVTYVYGDPDTRARLRFWRIHTAQFLGPEGTRSFDAHAVPAFSMLDGLSPAPAPASWHLPLISAAYAAESGGWVERKVSELSLEDLNELREFYGTAKETRNLGRGIGELMHPTPDCDLNGQMRELASGKALLGALKSASGITGALGGYVGQAAGFVDYLTLVSRMGASEAYILAGGCAGNGAGSTTNVDLPGMVAVPGDTNRQRLAQSAVAYGNGPSGSPIQLGQYQP
jgi:hypothetical protein